MTSDATLIWQLQELDVYLPCVLWSAHATASNLLDLVACSTEDSAHPKLIFHVRCEHDMS